MTTPSKILHMFHAIMRNWPLQCISSIVETVVVTRISKTVAISCCIGRLLGVWKAEEVAASTVLHTLCESLVPPDLDIANRSPRQLHCFFEMSLGQLWYRIFFLIFFHLDVFPCCFTLLCTINVDRNGLLNSELDSALSDKAKVSTRKAMSSTSNVLDVDIRSNGRFPKLCLEDPDT